MPLVVRQHRQRGLTLIEVMFALFLLLVAFTIIMALINRSTQALVQIERRVLAVAFSEILLDDLEQWARDRDNFRGSWTGWDGHTLAEYPGFSASITTHEPELMVPCTQLESQKLVTDQQSMAKSFKHLDLAVQFQGKTLFKTATLISEPILEVGSVAVVRPVGTGGLAPNESLEFSAVLLDADGEEIPDVTFHWLIVPIRGNATVERLSTDHSGARLTNIYRRMDNSTVHIPGELLVRATCRYAGREYSGLSETVEMMP